VELNAGYRLTRKTKLKVGYKFDWNERDLAEAEITREHTGIVKLSSNLSNMTRGWIEYAYSDRTHSNYDPTRPFRTGVDPALLPAGCSTPPFTGCITNDILTRKYYLAERQQNKVAGSLTMMPTDLVSLGITGNAINEDFDETVVGIQERTRYNATVDFGYSPREDIDTYAYYTHEFFDVEQAGWISGGDNDWLYDTEDRVNTLGAGIKWRNIKRKFDLTVDYTFSKAITEIDPTDIPIDTAIDFPDLKTTIHTVILRADYHLKDDVTMRMYYRFEDFSNDDWALDGIGQADISRVIWTGQQIPDYTAHFVGLSVEFKFQ
jgi:MtrB/PioB family decaheme-associated outer membrane protein